MMTMPTPLLLQKSRVKGLEVNYDRWKAHRQPATLPQDVKAFSRELGDIVRETMEATDTLLADFSQGIGFDFELLQEFMEEMLAKSRAFVSAFRDELDKHANEIGHRLPDLDAGIENVSDSIAACEKALRKLPWYGKPWPPLDRELQQRVRSGVNGPGEPIEDVLDRVLKGGPIVKG